MPSQSEFPASSSLPLAICLLLAVSLGVLLRLFVYPLVEPSARIWAILAGRVAVCIVWVADYRTLSRGKQAGINPFLNVAVSLGTPVAVDWVLERL
ncbi:hypothetical protein GE09DRAFT_217563 [Coniochaeta sp. 2T2.1]|nr:hypothetical protein GE09DRAFT_217563 [Coniochaeta sp. 2T2.1]